MGDRTIAKDRLSSIFDSVVDCCRSVPCRVECAEISTNCPFVSELLNPRTDLDAVGDYLGLCLEIQTLICERWRLLEIGIKIVWNSAWLINYAYATK